MRKYATNDAAGNRVGLNLGGFFESQTTPIIRKLQNQKIDNYVQEDVLKGLYTFVETHAPEFTGERGRQFTIKEVRSLELSNLELTKHCLDILLTHFVDGDTLRKTLKTLEKWNDYENQQNETK